MENQMQSLSIKDDNSKSKKIPVLVGDIGGTNSRLSVVKMSSVTNNFKIISSFILHKFTLDLWGFIRKCKN